MSNLRFKSLEGLAKGKKDIRGYAQNKVTDFYGVNVFSGKIQREFLSDEAYKSLQDSIKTGKKVDRAMADQIASAMRAWAMEKGVTHFTHWFQPLTGATAEKQLVLFVGNSSDRKNHLLIKNCSHSPISDPMGAENPYPSPPLRE